VNGRAGKFLDEERRLSEYPFQGSVGTLEVSNYSSHTDQMFNAVLRIRIWIRILQIHMFLGLLDPDPDPLVRGMDPDPSIIKQK
jgi:hypothetical protein